MTQHQLADRIGAKQSLIARLEDAEYEGQSISMLQKIARALNQRLEVHLIAIAIDKNHTEKLHYQLMTTIQNIEKKTNLVSFTLEKWNEEYNIRS